MGRPNILFLMTDQQRWDAMGCSGGWVDTPNMDRIAREGVRFTQCVTNSPVCIPARVSLATGLYPHNTGVWRNMQYTLPPETETWMRSIRQAGYRTSLFGKTHLHPHSGDLRDREHLMHAYGLDDVNEIGGPRASASCLSYMTAEWEAKGLWKAYREDFAERFSVKPHMVRPSTLGLENYYDTYVGREARTYLERYDRQEPWFCWVSFGGPHEPWDAPEPYASRYAPEAMPAAIPRGESRGERPQGELDRLMARKGKGPSPEEALAMRANYAGNVSLIDHQIGSVLDAVEARGEMENTVIALVSDHGEMNGDHGLTYKENFLDGAARIPLLVRTPETCRGAPGGEACSSPVELFDIGPTLVSLAGGELGHRQFAQSLCPLLRDVDADHRRDAMSQIRGEVMLLDSRWKVVLNAAAEPYLLFDLADDPEETHNLAGRPEAAGVGRDLQVRVLRRLMQAQMG